MKITKIIAAARACAVKRKNIIKRDRRTAAFLILALTLTGMTYNDGGYSVSIRADGEIREVRATGETIADILGREGIILGEFDEMNFSAEERVSPGMSIVIDRVEFIEKTTSEPIPYETLRFENTLERIGTEYVTVYGQDGRTDTTIKEKLVNGVVVSSEALKTEIIPPINEEITFGSALNEPYSRKEGDFSLENGLPAEFDYVLSGKVTAYTAPEGSGTYSGRPLEIGTVGVDPNIIPFGSELYICSKDGEFVYGYAIAADTGDFTEVIADVFMGTTSEHFSDACRWGAQDAYVYVLKTGDNSLLWH